MAGQTVVNAAATLDAAYNAPHTLYISRQSTKKMKKIVIEADDWDF